MHRCLRGKCAARRGMKPISRSANRVADSSYRHVQPRTPPFGCRGNNTEISSCICRGEAKDSFRIGSLSNLTPKSPLPRARGLKNPACLPSPLGEGLGVRLNIFTNYEIRSCLVQKGLTDRSAIRLPKQLNSGHAANEYRRSDRAFARPSNPDDRRSAA